MFERFTDKARRVLVLAQEEARLLDHNFIGTEHILLGLIREEEGLAAQALAAAGIGLETARAGMEGLPGPHEPAHTGSPPFTPRAKRVLEMSLREALQLGHNYIGTEHLLLGMLREGEGVGVQVLVSLGVDPAALRHHVIRSLTGQEVAGGQTGATAVLSSSRSGRSWRRAANVRPGRVRGGERALPPALTVNGEVSLTFGQERLTGTVGGEAVDMALVVPASDGRAEGSFAGAAVAATWRLAANETWHPDVPASLHGTAGGASVGLVGWFHLDEEFSFEHGAVEGEISGQPVAAYIEAGGAGSFAAHGSFSDSGFSLRATFEAGRGRLEGSVEGAPLDLVVAQVEGQGRTATLTGSYDGPLPLLLVLSGVLLFFP
jgi:hypothetical protein